jgi:hypothetical protein
MLNGAAFPSWEGWAHSLPSRSARTTLVKQLDKTWAALGIHVVTLPAEHLRWPHLLIVWQHQRRLQPWALAGLSALFRFLVARFMTGSVDFYINGRGETLAFCHYVLKGQVLRAMWFYTACPKSLLWFGALRAGVQRATRDQLWLDAGPSNREEIAELKCRYGFAERDDYRPLYAGAYAEVCSYAELRLGQPDAPGPVAARSAETTAAHHQPRLRRPAPADHHSTPPGNLAPGSAPLQQ